MRQRVQRRAALDHPHVVKQPQLLQHLDGDVGTRPLRDLRLQVVVEDVVVVEPQQVAHQEAPGYLGALRVQRRVRLRVQQPQVLEHARRGGEAFVAQRAPEDRRGLGDAVVFGVDRAVSGKEKYKIVIIETFLNYSYRLNNI